MVSNKKLSTNFVDNLVSNSGLNKCGFARPYLPNKWKSRFKKWLNKGYYAGMSWIKRGLKERLNIEDRFPWCDTVLVVADNYYSRYNYKDSAPYISLYARGENYHEIVSKKLNQVMKGIREKHPELQYKIYVDTGPIIERAYAVESGLGWMGKNSMVYIDSMGSYCFLGIALLNIEADKYGQPIESKCGDCKICLQNCPTGALERPYQHNSNKCISYLTIEKKGEFSSYERSIIGNHLYGCDTCIKSCPVNQENAQHTKDNRYYSKFDFLNKAIAEWEQVDKKEFQDQFQTSVFKRLSYDRFKRNLEAVKNNQDKNT